MSDHALRSVPAPVAPLSPTPPWLVPLTARLDAARRSGRFPHSLLLQGSPGIGARWLSEWIASALLCMHTDRAPCGECRACRWIAQREHPDLMILDTSEDSRQIRIEQVRELAGELALRSHQGGARVALLLNADALNRNSANALLKTLEEPPPGAFLVLSYHEVSGDLAPATAQDADRYGVEISHLVAQFNWLRENGYHPVSLAQIDQARQGGAALPARAVLLSFDDGYADFHSRVYPVLKMFGYPAVIALVGSWMDTPPGTLVDYDGKTESRDAFLSWAQVREMMASGLVEVASHSYALHRGVIANPQGNQEPAAVARIYDAATRSYEDDDAYLRRVREDLQRNVRLIERETGKAPRAMVWPYGRYNVATQRIARELGMPLMLTLDGGVNAPGDPNDRIRRIIVESSPDLGEFVDEIERVWPELPQRVVHVDLDYVYSADPDEQERNLSALLERIKAIRPTTVYLQAYADPDGDGEADALYFPNSQMPMRADLFNRVAWQLQTRVGVNVYAWMPVLAFRLPEGHPARDDLVQAANARAGSTYRRLSPFSPRARAAIASICWAPIPRLRQSAATQRSWIST